MAALGRIDTPALLSLGVLDRDPPLTALDEDDEGRDADRQCDQEQDDEGMEFARPGEFERPADGRGQADDDTGEDDHRDTVADPPFGDLFTEPHQKQRPGHERDDGRHTEDPARIDDDGDRPDALTLEGDRDPQGLEGREDDGQVARVLRQLAPAGFTLLLDLLERRVDGG